MCIGVIMIHLCSVPVAVTDIVEMSQIVARKSNRLPAVNSSQTNASDYATELDENSTDSRTAEADAEGPLMINISDGSRWFLPRLHPIPAVHLGVRG